LILLIDNYDSFTYNLYHLIGKVDPHVKVIRNDEKDIQEIAAMHPQAIVLSPGPGRPADAGICLAVIRHFTGKIPILGVCLGHQAICEALGGRITYAKQLMHGKREPIRQLSASRLLKGLPPTFKAARYHSLVADAAALPPDLKVTAVSDDENQEVMAVEHVTAPLFGVQFHPESVMTTNGLQIIKNFLEVVNHD
jgi:anthranilate synthase component 2